jgi:hypothetical protein
MLRQGNRLLCNICQTVKYYKEILRRKRNDCIDRRGIISKFKMGFRMGGRMRDFLILRTITNKHNYELCTPLRSNTLYQGVLGFQNIQLHGARVDVTSFKPTRKVLSSLHRPLRNSEALHSIMFRFITPNFIPTDTYRGKYG